MAIVHITLSDTFKDGREIISMDIQTDRQGLPQGAPDTFAMIQGANIARLWNTQALARMAGYVCQDLIAVRDGIIAQVQAAQQAGPGANGPPPPEGAAEKKPMSPEEMAKARASAADAEEPQAPTAA